MKTAILALFACLVASAVAETFYMVPSNNQIRLVNNVTFEASTVALNRPGKSVASLASPFLLGLVSPVYNTVSKKLNVLAAADNQIWELDTSAQPYTVKVLAGSATGAVGTTVGTGTNAGFTFASAMVQLNDGSLAVSGFGAAAASAKEIRKVTPAGAVSLFVGGVIGTTEGIGTDGLFTDIASMAADSQGNLYVGEKRRIRKVAPSLQTSTVAGASGTTGSVDGVGTAANFQDVNLVTLSKDEKTLYVASPNAAIGAAGAKTELRKVTIATGVVETIKAAPAAAAKSADGVGTDGVLGHVTGLSMDSEGNLLITEVGKNGGAIRKYVIATKTLSTVSSSIVIADLDSTAAAGAGTQVTPTDGVAADAKFLAPVGLSAPITIACNKVFAANAAISFSSDCSSLSGSVNELAVSGSKTTVDAPLAVAGKLSVGDNGRIQFDSATTVGDALVASGNGTVIVNGAAVTANTLVLSSTSTYNVVVDRAVPLIITVQQSAALAGDIVISIAKGFNFGVGSTATVLAYGSHTGSFSNRFLIYLQSALRSQRSLLQATGASVACGATSCAATGIASNRDDDDEVPYIVALVIVAIALFVLIVGALFFLGASKSRGNKKAVASSAAGPVEYSSSSSSSSLLYPEDQFDDVYYSYSA